MNFIISLLIIAAIWCLVFYWDIKREKDKRKAKIIDINKSYEPLEDVK